MALRAKPNVPAFQSDHHDNALDYDHDDQTMLKLMMMTILEAWFAHVTLSQIHFFHFIKRGIILSYLWRLS